MPVAAVRYSRFGSALSDAAALKSYEPRMWQPSQLLQHAGVLDVGKGLAHCRGVPGERLRALGTRVDCMDEVHRIRRPATARPVRSVAPRTGRAVVALATVESILGEGAQLLVALVAACIFDDRPTPRVTVGHLLHGRRDHDQAADLIRLPDWRRRYLIAPVRPRLQRVERQPTLVIHIGLCQRQCARHVVREPKAAGQHHRGWSGVSARR